MLPSERSVAFFALLLLGLLVSGVLTPVVLDPSAESESWGTAAAAAASASPLPSPPTPWLSIPAPPTSEIFQEEKWTDRPLSGDLVPVEESPPFVPDPKSALLLSSAESLSDLICICSDSSSHSVSVENQTLNSVVEDKVQLSLVKGIRKDVNLWRSNGFPSSQLLKIMRKLLDLFLKDLICTLQVDSQSS
uniref:Uncharacterized protein n=1 Tax=Musa acuminata subsp. malaccensis TaxID=214687 RepID=A0A804IHZ7_MUSAM